MNRSQVLIALFTGLVGPALVSAQPLPLGDPFRVNANSEGDQSSPHVAADGADNFRFVWTARSGDPAHSDVRTRRLQANGSLGVDSLLSETTAGDQTSPRIAMSPGGDWVAAWLSDHEFANRRTYGRFTTDDGTLLGAEFQYSQGVTTDAWNPSVAAVGDEFFVGAWRNVAGGNAARGNFRSRAGVQWGMSDIGATSASSSQTGVAGLTDESWVALWSAPDGDQNGAFVRCFHYDDPTGAGFAANAEPDDDQRWPDIASDGDSRFVVVWEEGLRIRGRLFRRDGVGNCEPIGDEFDVTAPGEDALYPRVSMATDGAFVVTWAEHTLDTDNGVAAREFTKDGRPVGERFAVRPPAEGSQYIPVVAVSATTFAIAWTTPDGGGSTTDIDARRFRRRVVFTDGFETGDLSGWPTP